MRHILLSISILSVWMMKVHTNFDDWPIDPRWIHRKKKAKELDTIYIDFDHEQITVFFCFVFMCICFLRTKLYIIENIFSWFGTKQCHFEIRQNPILFLFYYYIFVYFNCKYVCHTQTYLFQCVHSIHLFLYIHHYFKGIIFVRYSNGMVWRLYWVLYFHLIKITFNLTWRSIY